MLSRQHPGLSEDQIYRANNGLKASAARVLPQHSLDRAAAILNMNATINAKAKAIKSANNASTKCLWSNLPSRNKLTQKGESLVVAQWLLRDNYICEQVGNGLWHLLMDATPESPGIIPGFSLIPRFSRVRKVSVLKDTRTLLCSCMYFERTGLPCRHQMHVLCLICPDYQGITHHDVSVTWWSEFARYGFSSDPNHKEISLLYSRLLMDDVHGPTIPDGIDLPRMQRIHSVQNPSLVVKATIDTCVNYSAASIRIAMRHGPSLDDGSNTVEDSAPMGTQQETNVYSDTDSFCSFPSIGSQDLAVHEKSRPYSVLAPVFKELTSILEGNCSEEKLQHYKKFLSDSIIKEKKDLSVAKRDLSVARLDSGTSDECSDQSGPSGNMISCSVPSNKRHKSHGTKHM